LVEAPVTGAAGTGAELGAELLTQHGLSQTHRLQQDAGCVLPSAFAGSTDCVTASNKLNKMANVAFNQSTLLFGFRRGLIKFLHVFGRVFLEIFEAIFAAKLHFASFMFENVRLAHFAEFLIRNDAFIQRVSFVFCILVGPK